MMKRPPRRNEEIHVLTRIFLFYLLILSFFCLGLVKGSLAEPRLTAILNGLLGKYGTMPGLTVTYEREIVTKSMALLGDGLKRETAKGRMYFKAPHYLRLEQETPAHELLVSDGQILWWYVPDKKTAYRYPARKLGEEMWLLSRIFQGLKQVQDRFDVSVIPKRETGFDHLRLNPRPPWPQIEHIEIAVARDEHHIRIVEIYDYVGGITRFFLDEPESVSAFERGFFEFDVPRGTNVIDEGDQ